MNDLQILLLTIFVGLFAFLISYVIKFLRSALPGDDDGVVTVSSLDDGNRKGSKTGSIQEKLPAASSTEQRQQQQQTGKKKCGGGGRDRHHNEKAANYSHPWLMTSLKGHTGRILDFDLSPNGKYLATCSEDRTVLIWPLKDFAVKDRLPIRGNLRFDHADRVSWSPDGKAFLVHKYTSNQIEVYKFSRQEEGGGHHTVSPGSLSFNVGHSNDADTIAMQVASNGKFIMSCSSKTAMVIYDLKGDVLNTIDTLQVQNYCGKVSPDGNLVAASGFTPDVKVWEVKFSKSSAEFERRQKKAFELTGNASGVFGFAFNVDSTKVATVSRDGTWKVFCVKVDRDRGEDPVLVTEGRHDVPKDLQDVSSVKVAFSPDSKIIAVSCLKDIFLFSVASKQKLAELVNVHTEPVTGLTFDPEGKWLLSCGDRHVRVFHNLPGFEQNIEDLTRELKVTKSQSAKLRINQQMELLQKAVKAVRGPPPS